LIDSDDQDANEREDDELHLEVASEHSNSWGGLQYEPDDEFDEHKFVQQDEEEPEEEQNASEEEPDIQIATMRTLQMHAMCKIKERRPEITEPYIADIEDIIPNTREPSSANEGSSNIEVTHIELSVEQPDNSRLSPTSKWEDHNTCQFRNELPVVHSYLYESEAEISDPVFIEYRDGLIFREELGQDMDQFIEAAQQNNCRLCNNCQPLVRIHRFMGSDGKHYYYYCIYTCWTPVEWDQATEEISDDEDLNVERFFSAQIICSPSPSSSINEEMVTADDPSRQQESGNDNHLESPTDIPALMDVVIESESVGYIDDPPERSNWTFTMTTGSLWDIPVDTEINLSDITCDVCHECSLQIVTIYRNTDGGTWFIWFQQICRNTATWHNADAVADSSKPDHASNPPSKMEERDCEGADELPNLIPITNGEENTSKQEHVTKNGPDESSSSEIDKEDDILPDKILECPYCHNCEPRTKPAYYFRLDGEVFYRERLICQAPKDNESPAGSSLHAMHMVYSSNVRRKTTTNSDQPISDQPIRSSRLQATLAAEIEINGTKALTLFDSSSTTDLITPEFAFVTKAPQVKLEEQVVLQLGCVGSRSKISYGTKVPTNFGRIKDKVYFDLVNINRYDCIIGTPFMNTHGVCLNFGTCSIQMNGVEIKAFTFDEEQAYINSKRPVRGGRRPPPRETAPLKKSRADPSPSTWLDMTGSTRVEPAQSWMMGTKRPTTPKKHMVNIRANRKVCRDAPLKPKKKTGNPDKSIASKKHYIPSNIPPLCKHWFKKCVNLLGPMPLELPPFREVNHRIPLIDDKLRYNHHTPQCPKALQEELWVKITRYTTARWWEMKAVYQASPLLCVPKKSGKLCTVVDTRKQNDNTFKDVTPFPDQDQIRMDVACMRYQTKIDMSDPYKQIRVEKDDVWKTAFTTTLGTSVATVVTDVFQINWFSVRIKISKISKIFGKIEDPENRGVI
jgi:hypothetical protein